MKPLSFLVMVVISLCASLCCQEEDDIFANTEFVTNNNLITVDNNASAFNVDDVIFIETSINNNQTTTNSDSINLSDFTYSEIGQSRAFMNLTLYRESGFGSVVEIPLNESAIEVIDGEVTTNGEFIQVSSLYDGSGFRSRFGIKLLESGTYYLAGTGLLSSSGEGTITISIGVSELGFVNIDSSIVNSDTQGRYTFTVN